MEVKLDLSSFFATEKENHGFRELDISVRALLSILKQFSARNKLSGQKSEKLLAKNLEKYFQSKVKKLSEKYSKIAGKIKEKTEIYQREIENGSFASNETFSCDENIKIQTSENFSQIEIQEIEKMDLERLSITIQELSDLFDKMGIKGFEEGKVVDRIDAGTLESVVLPGKVNLEIARAVDNQEDGRGEKCMRVLSVIIIILTFFLLWKFS